MSKLAGEKWKKMSDADKKPWQKQYAKKKAEYEKLLEEWGAKKAAGGDHGGDDGDDDEHDE